VADIHYYMLSFGYAGPTSNVNISEEASTACADALEKVEKQAKIAELDIRHAYVWPDGSLYKYLRTDGPADYAALKKVFDDGVYLVGIDNQPDYQILGGGIDVLTLEERFAGFDRETTLQLAKERNAEREGFYATYRKARKECETCTAPGLGCKECMKLCREAEETQKKWRQQLRPLRK